MAPSAAEIEVNMTSSLVLSTAVLTAWLAAIFFYQRPQVGKTDLQQLVYPGVLGVYILLWASADSMAGHSSLIKHHHNFLAVVAAFLTIIWLTSLIKKDTSIMDIAYPLTAAVPVLILMWGQYSGSAHEILLAAFVGLWSLRLSGHIAIRNLPEGEDARYSAWRKRFGRNWWWWSLFQVFVLQGILVSLWSVPLILAIDVTPTSLGFNHVIAILLFCTGFYFQAVADYQLERFRKTRAGPHEILDHGLWALSRHPNYFGESLIWWSFGFLGLSHELGLIGLLAPLYVTWFMARGSATPMQEKYLSKKKPGYDSYAARVPEFFPRLKR